VWSFTTEPAVYAMQNITATASSFETGYGPENAVNGSGLTDDLYHGTAETTMWLTSKTDPLPVWIQFEFDKIYRIEEMWVWNYNVTFESVLGLGMKDVTVEYSLNGTDWTVLCETQFATGQGKTSYEHDTTVDCEGIAAKYVRLTCQDNWGDVSTQCGLSEVRFFYTPTHASHPAPDSAEAAVSPDASLRWRPGREAVSHKVFFSADQQAVIDGTATGQTTTETSYDPGSLLLSETYYWRVDEVNEAASPSLWEGTVWSFSTSEYLVVDDFESYTDNEGSWIYEFWIDGWGIDENGSQAGYTDAPFAERNTVHGGSQAMPLIYDNSTAAYSEVVQTFEDAQDWTDHGVTTLSLYFYGPAENTVGQMYLKIDETKVNYAGSMDDLKSGQWMPWTVDLSSLGVNLKKVKTLCIGIENAGITGTLFVDDIQLLP